MIQKTSKNSELKPLSNWRIGSGSWRTAIKWIKRVLHGQTIEQTALDFCDRSLFVEAVSFLFLFKLFNSVVYKRCKLHTNSSSDLPRCSDCVTNLSKSLEITLRKHQSASSRGLIKIHGCPAISVVVEQPWWRLLTLPGRREAWQVKAISWSRSD